MKILLAMAGAAVLVWGGASSAHGQKATEMYIPVGQSPGLSGRVTIAGKIEAIDAAGRTVLIAGPTGPRRASVTDRTKIWLDRSKLRLPNQRGTFSDLRRDLTVEVKYEDGAGQDAPPAEWIKLQVDRP